MPLPPQKPEIIQLADGLFVRQAVDNMAWIDMGGYVLIVDALEDEALEAEVLRDIHRTLGDVDVRYVVNTHTHYDHIALNEAFRRRFGCEIVNRQTCDISSEAMVLSGDSRAISVHVLTGCHSEDDCVIWCADDGVLFVGDIFGWGLLPLIINIKKEVYAGLRKAYERLLRFDAKVVVPGHGPLCTQEELRRWLAYLDWLIEEVLKACASGMDDADISAHISAPADMRDWWWFEQWHADNLRRVVKSARRGWL